MSTQKLSITVEAEVAKALKAKVATRTLSQFVNRAIVHELERERLRELIAHLEVELGPADETMVGEASAAFDQVEAAARRSRKRKSRARR